MRYESNGDRQAPRMDGFLKLCSEVAGDFCHRNDQQSKGRPAKRLGQLLAARRHGPSRLGFRRSRDVPERVFVSFGAEMFATIASSNDGPAHYATQEPGTTTPLPFPANSVAGTYTAPDSADDQQSMRYRET